MSSTIDERVVEMRFDNQKFEKNARTTMKTLEALDKSLELKGSTKGFQDLEKAAKSVDLSHLEKSLDFVANKFTFLGKIGDKVITDLAHKFTNFFEKIAKSFTTDQISSGWAKYEAKTNAVQVIMHATGKSIDEVNEALDTLNHFTDETSYRFDQLVDVISGLAGAGVADKNLKVIEQVAEGISNAAATAGISAKDAGRIYYNMTQAFQAHVLRGQDWSSLEMAGFGTEEFRAKAIEVAEALIADGKASKEMETAFNKAKPTINSFKDSLSYGWLNDEVLTEVFVEYADVTTEFGLAAFKAGQEAKTFTDAVDSAKEAVASGWAKVFEQIFGNYEEARVFWTEVADEMIDVVSAPVTALADFLKEWHKQGGYVAFINSIRNAWAGVKAIGEAVGEVFRNVFPPIDPSVWVEKTQKLEQATKRWMSSLTKIDANEELQELFASGDMDAYLAKLTEVEEHNDAVDKKLQPLRDTLQGVFAILKLVKSLSSALFKIVLPFTKLLVPIANLVGTITGALGRVSSSIADAILNSELFNGILALLAKVANVAVTAVTWLGDKLNWLLDNVLHLPVIETFVNFIKELGSAIHGLASPYIEKIANAFKTLYSTLSKFISENLSTIIEGIGKALQYIGGVFIFAAQTVWKFLQPAFSAIGRIFRSLYNSIKSFVERQNLSEVFERIGAGVTAFCDAIGNAADVVWNWLKPAFDWFIGIVEDAYNAVQTYLDSTDFDEILDDIADALTNFGGAVIYAAGAVWDWLQPAFQGIANVAKRIWERIKVLADGIKNYWNNVVIPSGVLNYIIQGMKNIAKNAKNFALSLVEYIKNGGLFGIYEWVRDKFSEIWNLIKSFNFSKLIGDSLNLAKIGGILAGILALYRTTRLLKNVGTFLKEFPKSLKAYSKGLGIKRVATAILMIAGALYVLSLVPPGRLWELVGAIAALGGILTVFTIALGAFAKSMETTSSFTKDGNKFTRTTNSITKVVGAMLVMAASILILSVALKKISDIDSKTLWNSVGALTVIMLAFASSAALIGAAKTSVVQVGIGMLALAAGIWLMVLAIDQVNKLFAGLQTDQETLTKVVWVISGIAIVLMGLAFVLKKVEKATFELAAMIAAIGAAVLLVALAVKLLTTLNRDELETAAKALIGVVAIITLLMLATKLLPKDRGVKQLIGVAAVIISFGAAVLLLVAAVKQLGEMDTSVVETGLSRLAAVLLMFVPVLIAASFVRGKAGAFVGLAVMIVVVILALKFLSEQDFGKMAKAAILLGTVMLAVGASLLLGSIAMHGKAGAIFGIAFIIAALVGALYILTLLDQTNLMNAVTSLSAVLVALGAAMALMGLISIVANPKVILSIGAMVLGIAGALWILGQLPLANMLAATIALKQVLWSLVLAISVLSLSTKMGDGESVWKQAAKIGLMITAVLVPLILSIWALSAVANAYGIANFTTVSGVIAVLMAEMAVIVKAISSIPASNIPNWGDILKLAGMITAIIIPVVGGLALAKAIMPDPNGLIEIATAIAEVMAAVMIPIVAIMALAQKIPAGGAGTSIGNSAVAALDFGIIFTVIATFLAGIGMIVNLFNGEDGNIILDGLETATTVATSVGEAVGGLIGGLVGGLVAGGVDAIVDMLPEWGTKISEFFTNIQGGIEEFSNISIDESSAKGLESLASAMLIFTASSVLEGLTSWLTGEVSFTDFANGIKELGPGLKQFATDTEGIDSESVEGAAAAIKTLSDAAAHLSKHGGIWQDIVGETQGLDDFADELIKAGPNLKTFATDHAPTISGNQGYIEGAAAAIQKWVDLANSIHNDGGLWDDIFGETQSLDSFAQELITAAPNLVDFAVNYAKQIGDQETNLKKAAAGVGAFVDIANALVATDVSYLWGAYEEHRQTLGEFMSDFSDTSFSFMGHDVTKKGIASNLKDLAAAFEDINVDALDLGVTAVSKLVEVGKAITGTSTTVGDFGGWTLYKSETTTLGEWLKDLVGLKDDLVKFTGIFDDNTATQLINASTVLGSLVDLDVKLADLKDENAGHNLEVLALNMATAAEYLNEASGELGDLDYMLIDSMLAYFSNNLQAVLTLGKGNITEMLAAMVEEGALQTTSTATTIVKDLNNKLDNELTRLAFKNTGSNLGKEFTAGFADGITKEINAVVSAATSLSNTTIETMRRVLRIHSPSRVARQIGSYTGEGYYLGLEDWLNPSATAGEDLAQATTESVLGMLDYIQGIMNGDLVVDMRIRPVLDLSEVRLGFGQLDSMFSQRQAIMAQLNAEDLSHRDEVAELVDVSWKILKEIQNGRVVYLDGKVVANSVNNRLGRMEG